MPTRAEQAAAAAGGTGGGNGGGNAPGPTTQALLTAITDLVSQVQIQSGNTTNLITQLQQSQPTRTSASAPKMGAIEEVEGRKEVRMGGIPDVGWTKRDKKSAWRHPGQCRSLDEVKTLKTFEHIEKLSPRWNKTMNLVVLQEHVIKQAINLGVEQNLHLKHPHKNEMVNVMEHPHFFTQDLDLLVKAVNAQTANHDSWDETSK